VSVPGDLQEIARREMLEMIERLLLEADLEKELPKLEVYGKTIDGIKEFLNFLLMNPETGRTQDETLKLPQERKYSLILTNP
jgi:hypothetical protein